MKLSAKITTLVIFITVLFSVTSVTMNRRLHEQYLRDSQAEWVSTLVHVIAESIAQATIDGNTLKARRQLQSIVNLDEALEYAYISNFDGVLFAHTFENGFPRFLLKQLYAGRQKHETSFRYITPDGEINDVEIPLIEGMYAHLHIGINQNEITTLVGKVKNDILVLAFVISLIGIVISLYLGRRISTPLSILSAWMHEYGEGRRQERLNIPKADAEVAKLVASFNAMLEGRLQLEAGLRESESYNRMLFNTSPVGLALSTMDGKLVDVNPAYANIVGRTVDEVKKLTYWDITPEDYAENEQQQLENLKTRGYYGPYEKEYIHRDGHRVPVRLKGQIIERGEQQYIWSSVVDITEQKKVEKTIQLHSDNLEQEVHKRTQQYKKAKEEAENANKAKTQFLSSMSHELRTPLNAILGFSQLLEMDEKDDESKENFQEIINAGNHLLELISQVLDLSKIESGMLSLSIDSHSLNDLLNDSLSTIKPVADKYSIAIDNKVDLSLNVRINVDKGRFKQVLLNLLSNAIKYNSVNGKVTIDCSSNANNMLCLSITDTGKGLTPEQQDHLFKPFDRAGAESSNIQGTGLGLVICKDLIEQMNGKIGFESEIGKGSRFWIQVPIS